MQSATERRQLILDVMNIRRRDTIVNLATEFNVSISTMMRDIKLLSCFVPIYTVQGKGGGVFMVSGYYTSHNYLTAEQEKAIIEVINGSEPNNEVLKNILVSFSKPKN